MLERQADWRRFLSIREPFPVAPSRLATASIQVFVPNWAITPLIQVYPWPAETGNIRAIRV